MKSRKRFSSSVHTWYKKHREDTSILLVFLFVRRAMFVTFLWVYIITFMTAVAVIKVSHKLSYGHIPDLYNFKEFSSYLGKARLHTTTNHTTLWMVHLCVGHVAILLSTIQIVQAAIRARRRAKSMKRLLEGMSELATILASQVKDEDNKKTLENTAAQIQKTATGLTDPKSRPL